MSSSRGADLPKSVGAGRCDSGQPAGGQSRRGGAQGDGRLPAGDGVAYPLGPRNHDGQRSGPERPGECQRGSRDIARPARHRVSVTDVDNDRMARRASLRREDSLDGNGGTSKPTETVDGLGGQRDEVVGQECFGRLGWTSCKPWQRCQSLLSSKERFRPAYRGCSRNRATHRCSQPR